MAKLGEIIRNYRFSQSPKVTLDELAKRSGLSKSYLSMLENEKFPRGKAPKITGDILLKLAKGMNTDVDTIASKLDDNQPLIIIQGNKTTSSQMDAIIDRELSESDTSDRKPYITKALSPNPPIIAPVLGRVAAGVPIEMITEILDTEELDPKDFPPGNYFGLVIQGDSMEPKISEGDVVIVRQQPDIESGQTAIVSINGDDATCKKIMKYENGIMLISSNPKYPPKQYSNDDIENLPITILGRVVELRAKF